VRARIWHWILVGLGGLILAGAGWIVFAPAHWYYTPTTIGLANRVNVFAGFGVVTVVYATFAVLGLLASRVIRPLGEYWVIVPIAAACVLATGYLQWLTVDKRSWDRSWDRQETMLQRMKAAVPDPPDGSTFLTFAWPGFEKGAVPIFASNWDLNGAVQVQWDDRTLNAFPILEGSTLSCDASGVTIHGPGYQGFRPRPYGRVYFIDVNLGKAVRPRDRVDCGNHAPSFPPGPISAKR
jgi:hypothetical protein